MKKLHLGILASAALVFTPSIHAAVNLWFGDYKQFRQTDTKSIGFDKGELHLELRDGIIVYTGCDGNDGPVRELPNIFCPVGTTGFIASGDANGDGIRDTNSYWSIVSVIPAIAIAPFQPTKCALSAAPPSTLPRPLTPITDISTILFFNVLTAVVKEYDVTHYLYSRIYDSTSWSRMNKEVVNGQYIFTFPSLAKANTYLPISSTIIPFVEGYAKASTGIVSGLRINNGAWWQGQFQIDPRLIQSIKWEGNSLQNCSPTNDALYFTILDSTETTVLFPGSGSVASLDRLTQSLLLANSLVTSYTMPPYFFTAGDTAVISIDFVRNWQVSSVAYDISQRALRTPVLFVDSYSGYAQSFPNTYPATYPVVAKRGTVVPASAIAPNGDYDGDGVSNFVEFAFGSNPQLATSVPLPAYQTGVNTVTVGGLEQLQFPRRPFAGSTITYTFEQKVGAMWVKITPGVGGWVLVNPSNAAGAPDPAGAFVTLTNLVPMAHQTIRVTPVFNPLPTA